MSAETSAASSTKLAPQAVMHHSAAVVQKSIAAATQNAAGQAARRATARGRRRVDRQASRVGPPGDQPGRSERGEQRDAPAGAGRGRQRQRADQHHVGDAGRHVGLGQRDRAALAVVVGRAAAWIVTSSSPPAMPITSSEPIVAAGRAARASARSRPAPSAPAEPRTARAARPRARAGPDDQARRPPLPAANAATCSPPAVWLSPNSSRRWETMSPGAA